ncbi:hypothetical protein SLEP1_g36805 [Rubroshorea leprosula]|uniref:Uncharacterized protein n=1 Tax=Rubroshorea leprosula TaxID=152421 RepID=A0AAV5KSN9_9ROSI|nr:hypothetical protein SLEP1_g36805 [Rubroshorea leprosula]
MAFDDRGLDSNGSQLKSNLSIGAEESKPFTEETTKSHVNVERHVPEEFGTSEPVLEQGGIVLSGGLIVFIFSRNPTTLLFGGALLALSTFSLKIWSQGKSILAGVFLWKNIEAYSLTRKIFPAGFYAAISAAMLSFYIYVVISGGSPAPKKLKLGASEQS